MAPEVIWGDHYSELAYVYSFGIVMWEMVTKEAAMCGTHLRGRYAGRA